MNQVDYKKMYDEALERMKSWVRGEHPECFSEARKAAEFIFPELKEGEDEKVRKSLISFLKSPFVNENITDEKVSPWIAWLEKQGQTYTKKDVEDAYLQGVRGSKQELEGQDEQKYKFNIGDIISNGKVVYWVENITKNCIGQDCYFLVNAKSEKMGMRYLLMIDSRGNTYHFGETTWLCEQVDKSFEKQGEKLNDKN